MPGANLHKMERVGWERSPFLMQSCGIKCVFVRLGKSCSCSRSLECKICEAKFTGKRNLNTHVKLQHWEKLYHCSSCMINIVGNQCQLANCY